MIRRWIVIGGMALALAGEQACFAQAANPQNRKQQQNRNQAANRARNNVQTEQKQVQAAAAQIGAAKSRLEKARDQAVTTRHEVVTQHNKSPTIDAARKSWDDARNELAQVSLPVLDRLKLDPDYSQAVTKRDALREKEKKAPPDSREHTEAQKAWTDAAARVRQLERQALLEDPRTKVALETVEREESDLRALVQQKEREIKTDSQIASATQEIQQAKAALASAQAHYADELRKLAQAQQNYLARANQARNSKYNRNNRYRRW